MSLNGHFTPRLFANDAEQFVIAAILTGDPETPQLFSMLDASDFGRFDCQTAYRRMQALYKRNEPIDRVTLYQEMSLRNPAEIQRIGGLSWLAQIDNGMPLNSHPVRYAQMVLDASGRRRGMTAADAFTKELTQASDVQVVYREHQERMARMISDAQPVENIDLLERIPTLAGQSIDTRYLVEDLLVECGVTMFTGSYGGGKSTFAMAMGYAVATGRSFLGRATLQRPVIIIDRENGIDTVKERMLRLKIRDDEFPLRVWGLWGDAAQRQPPGPDSPGILAYARKYRPLMIWDSLIAFAGCDENSAWEMRAHMQNYRRLTAEGATCAVLHHASDKGEGLAYRGSSDIPAAVDHAYLLSRDDGTDAGAALGRILLRPYKTRISPGKPIRLEYTEAGFVNVDSPPVNPSEVMADLIGKFPGATQKELISQISAAGVGKNKALDVLNRMVLSRECVLHYGRHNTARYYMPDAGPKLVEP